MATNILSVYDPIIYAQEALTQLEKALGMAGRVFRGYDKAPREKGSTISIRVPSTFAVADAPAAAQALNASELQVTVDLWREVKFALTDKELSYTQQQIIDEHIRPAAYALADDIDQHLAALITKIPWYADMTSPAAVADITAARKILFNNRNPMNDGNLHLMIDGAAEADFLNLQAFSQFQGAGPSGVETQMRGTLGQKFGFEIFSNQNVPTFLSNTIADPAGTINNAPNGYAKGATSVVVAAFEAAGVVKEGDIVTIAGDAQQYTITEGATANAGAITLKLYPALAAAVAHGAVITVVPKTTGSGAQNVAFHRDAFALAMAPLSDLGNGMGAQITPVFDPKTNLALRHRMFYNGDASAVVVALDVLYGVKVLNPNRAVRLRAS